MNSIKLSSLDSAASLLELNLNQHQVIDFIVLTWRCIRAADMTLLFFGGDYRTSNRTNATNYT